MSLAALHPCRCQPRHLGQPVDAAALNRGWRGLGPSRGEPAAGTIRAGTDQRRANRGAERSETSGGGAAVPFLVVPGYCPHFGWRHGLHPRAAGRLERARRELERGRAETIIVSGGAVHSDDNEAVLMRAWLVERGVDPARILVEPCARHTTTNLRNAGRLILAAGAREALVVTSGEQRLYLQHPWRSSFHLRCLVQLGYRVGELGPAVDGLVRFVPSADVFRDSPRETRHGDP